MGLAERYGDNWQHADQIEVEPRPVAMRAAGLLLVNVVFFFGFCGFAATARANR